MLTEVDEKFKTQHAVQSEIDITAEEAVLSELAALTENSRLVDITIPSYQLTTTLPTVILDQPRIYPNQTVTQLFNGVTRELFKTKPIILDSLKNSAPEKPKTWPLPDELTLLIFYYLDPKSIVRCMLTCKYFLTIANDDPIRAFLFSAYEKNRMSLFYRDRSFTTLMPNSTQTILNHHLHNPPQPSAQEILGNLEQLQPLYHPGEDGKNNGFTTQRNF